MTPKPVDASFRRHGLWALTGRLANFAIVACSAFIFARLMPSKADFGTFTYLQSIVALLGIVGGVGSGTVAIRWISEARHEEGSVAEPLLKIAKTLAVTATVIGIATGVGLAAWPTSGSFSAGGSLAFVLIGCAVALRSTHQFVGGAARAESRLKTANLLDGANGGAISNGLLLLGVIATSCFVSVTWQRAVVSMAIANLVTALVGIWLLRDLFRTDAIDDEPSATTVSSPSMLSVGVPVAAASLLVFLVEQLDLLFAGWTLSEDSLADYSAAKRVSLVLRMPFAMVNMAVTGIITKRYIAGEKESLQSLLSGTATISLVASLMGALPLFLFPQTMLWLGFGGGYQQAATTMCILLIGQLIIVLGGSSQQLLILTQHERKALMVNAAAAMFFILCLVLLTFRGASVVPESVACTFTLTTLLRSLGMWWLARRLAEINTAPTLVGARWAWIQLGTLPVLKRFLGRRANEESFQ